jgi:hypothetical protein
MLTLLTYRLLEDNMFLTAVNFVIDLADWHRPLKIILPMPIFMFQYNIKHNLY